MFQVSAQFFTKPSTLAQERVDACFARRPPTAVPLQVTAAFLNFRPLKPEAVIWGCYVIFPRDNIRVSVLSTYISCNGSLVVYQHESVNLQLRFASPSAAAVCRGVSERWVVQTGFEGQYLIRRNSGAGTFSKVELAIKLTSAAEEKFAVKTISKKLVEEQNLRKYVRGEIETLRLLSHPNVLHLFGVFEDSSSIRIVTEHLEGGCLSACLSSGPVSDAMAAGVGLALLSALQELHQYGLVHRDIKPENVMLNSQGVVKLIDFGLVADLRDFSPECALNDKSGTVAYIAPEVALRQPHHPRYDHRADLFSLGVLLYEATTGKNPFRRDDYAATYANNMNGAFDPAPLTCAPGIADCISGLIVVNPSGRLTIAAARERLLHASSAQKADPRRLQRLSLQPRMVSALTQIPLHPGSNQLARRNSLQLSTHPGPFSSAAQAAHKGIVFLRRFVGAQKENYY